MKNNNQKKLNELENEIQRAIEEASNAKPKDRLSSLTNLKSYLVK